MTFGGRRPSEKDNLQWKTHSVEDDLWWKMTFGGRRLWVKDDHGWKTALGERQPLVVEDDLRWILAC